MTDTIIIAAKRALVKRRCGVDDLDALEPEFVEQIEADVRAVLGAVREPTSAMVEEGAGVIPVGQGEEIGPLNYSDAAKCWRAMIDAALAEPNRILD